MAAFGNFIVFRRSQRYTNSTKKKGTLSDRRTGVSRTLGPSAKSRAGYKAQEPVWQMGARRIVRVSSSTVNGTICRP